MNPMGRSIPLFPLSTVLFPNTTIPLHIFEERYKLMLQDCLGADSRFGVILIKSGIEVGGPVEPFSVGTIAHITRIDKVESNGMDISVTGEQRFKIKNINQYTPYMSAEVNILSERDNDEGKRLDSAKVGEIIGKVNEYARLILGLRGGWVNKTRIPSEPAALSYFIANMMQLELIQKQSLLEESTISNRLEQEMKFLNQILSPLKEKVSRELRKRFSRQ